MTSNLHKTDIERLKWSLQTLSSSAPSPYDILSAAEFLVAYGHVNEADIAIRKAFVALRDIGISAPRTIDRLSRVNGRLRSAGINRRVAGLGELGVQLLSSTEEAVLVEAPGAKTLLVVFGSMHSDFWVSYPVLHCLLPTERVSVLYLKDPAELMFLRGLPSLGSDFEALCDAVRDFGTHVAADIRIMGFSSGGYGGLLLATTVRAAAFLGFSIRTDLAPSSQVPRDRYVEREQLRAAVPEHLIDLRPLLQTRGYPTRGILYYGCSAKIDAAHARHLADLPNFTVLAIPETLHNSVMTLMALGQFDGIVRKFLS